MIYRSFRQIEEILNKEKTKRYRRFPLKMELFPIP